MQNAIALEGVVFTEGFVNLVVRVSAIAPPQRSSRILPIILRLSVSALYYLKLGRNAPVKKGLLLNASMVDCSSLTISSIVLLALPMPSLERWSKLDTDWPRDST